MWIRKEIRFNGYLLNYLPSTNILDFFLTFLLPCTCTPTHTNMTMATENFHVLELGLKTVCPHFIGSRWISESRWIHQSLVQGFFKQTFYLRIVLYLEKRLWRLYAPHPLSPTVNILHSIVHFLKFFNLFIYFTWRIITILWWFLPSSTWIEVQCTFRYPGVRLHCSVCWHHLIFFPFFF